MIQDDIPLSRAMHNAISEHPELRAVTQNLSICTFRYVPTDLAEEDAAHEEYLDAVNRELLERIQAGGEIWVSNAVVNKTFLLRACIVNFRTNLEDVRALPDVVVRLRALVDQELRPTWKAEPTR
jgi:glutamate/tyrosine decarboxylase-like PLP-dependent enzyme